MASWSALERFPGIVRRAVLPGPGACMWKTMGMTGASWWYDSNVMGYGRSVIAQDFRDSCVMVV